MNLATGNHIRYIRAPVTRFEYITYLGIQGCKDRDDDAAIEQQLVFIEG